MGSKVIKVCVLTSSFPRWEGDYAGHFIYDLLRKVSEQGGVDTTVVAPQGEKPVTHERFGGLKIRAFQYMWPRKLERLAYGGGMPHNLRSSFMAKCQLPLFVWRLFALGFREAGQCDVIHANWILSGLVGVMLKMVLHRPLILTVHGSDVNALPQSALANILARATFKKFDKIIAVSRGLEKAMLELGVHRKKIVFLPNGVDVESFTPSNQPASKNNILWIGRMTEEKGLAYMIEAMVEIVDKKPDVKLILVGSGGLEGRLRRMTVRLGLGTHVSFEGKRPHYEIPNYLRRARLLVLPSLSEGLPVAMLEALSCGIPVVGSRIGGISEVIKDGETGFLVTPGAPEELSAAIIKLLSEEKLRVEFGGNGIDLMTEKYNLTTIARKTLATYSEALSSYSKRRN
ncbi:MAG: glycosyltransferase [Deltaproteobacteria bacterium]|nr:glycosyltransferase [Deltaproteobacteria bacterium]